MCVTPHENIMHHLPASSVSTIVHMNEHSFLNVPQRPIIRGPHSPPVMPPGNVV